MSGRRRRPTGPGTPANRLRPVERFRPLNPDKPLAPTRVPPLKAFDPDMPGQLTLDDMGAIELPEEDE